MLRGHVDLLTSTVLAGWAVDLIRPNEPVDICIFVDGHKLAQVTCDHLREDLIGIEGLGNGRHGFRYNPYPPLTGPAPKRVTVRHASTGRILGNGDLVLHAGTTTPPADLSADLPTDCLIVPAPETPRQTFDLFSLYDRGQGLYNLLRQMDFSGRSATQLAYAALGGLAPVADKVPPVWQPEAARDMLNELLLSRDFQQNVLRLLLQAYPEKRRLLLVHIPKCAGSDLSHHLMGRYPSIAEQLRELHWTDKRLLFEALSDTVRRLHFSDTIFVRGHVNLADYLDQGLARPCDRLFTILRDPIDGAISQINYILMRLKEDVAAGEFRPDMQDWLPFLELGELPSDLSDAFLCGVGERALRRPEIVIPNPMCHWLGGGAADTVLARLAEHEVEVTTTQQYARWRRERWGIAADTRQNESTKYLTRHAVSAETLAYLREITAEDARLYRAVDQRLVLTRASSVTDWATIPVETAAAA
ncbi:MAG TPA: hypothetical protein VK822_14725 [Acetobacteraceae bacterium]|jgi:hypothetical protein|nr:hypothetical protein [Acetobacteraceae bacterium]